MSVLRVVEPFSCDVQGLPRVYSAGDLVHSTDPVVSGRERFFVTVEEFADRGAATVEQATAAPGERRTRGRRSGKTLTPTPSPAPADGDAEGDDVDPDAH